MVTCQSCGTELIGPFCTTCGAKSSGGAPLKKLVTRPSARRSGPRSDLWPWVALGLAAIMVFSAGLGLGYLTWGKSAPPAAEATADKANVSAEPADIAGLPPISKAGKYLDQGAEFLNKQDRTSAVDAFRKAVAEYDKVLKEKPDDPYAKTYLGLTYFYLSDDAKAFDTVKSVLAKDPNYLWAIFNLAWMSQAVDRKSEAMALFQKYIDTAPEERKNGVKYADHPDLIDRQLEMAKQSVQDLSTAPKPSGGADAGAGAGSSDTATKP